MICQEIREAIQLEAPSIGSKNASLVYTARRGVRAGFHVQGSMGFAVPCRGLDDQVCLEEVTLRCSGPVMV